MKVAAGVDACKDLYHPSESFLFLSLFLLLLSSLLILLLPFSLCSLWNVGLTEESLKTLGLFLPQCVNAKTLFLESNTPSIKAENYDVLLSEEIQISNLSLRHNGITDTGVKLLSEVTMRLNSIRRTYLIYLGCVLSCILTLPTYLVHLLHWDLLTSSAYAVYLPCHSLTSCIGIYQSPVDRLS